MCDVCVYHWPITGINQDAVCGSSMLVLMGAQCAFAAGTVVGTVGSVIVSAAGTDGAVGSVVVFVLPAPMGVPWACPFIADMSCVCWLPLTPMGGWSVRCWLRLPRTMERVSGIAPDSLVSWQRSWGPMSERPSQKVLGRGHCNRGDARVSAIRVVTGVLVRSSARSLV